MYPFLVILIFIRKVIKKEDPLRYKEKIFSSNFNVNKKKDNLIWFHAASIGELKSILPIITELNKKYKTLEFLITTITLSSGKLANEEIKKIKNVSHRYLPIDVEFLINKFINLWEPKAIILVDSEIWPNLIFSAKKNNITLGLLNARITYKTYKRWMIFPRTAKKIFGSFDFCLTSNIQTKKYLLKFNVKNAFFKGNIKFINTFKKNDHYNFNKKRLLNKRFWVAASTHYGEETFCLEAHKKLKDEFPDIVTIIAPRHIDRVKDVKKLCQKFKLSAQILKKNEIILNKREIIIINSFGILHNFFRYAKSVFVGKSTILKLKDDSGQNPIDAAKLGCKIYHGPYVYNFHDIYKLLQKKNVAKMIKNPLELSKYLIIDFKEQRNKKNKYKPSLENLEKKIFKDTMKSLDNYLFNEIL